MRLLIKLGECKLLETFPDKSHFKVGFYYTINFPVLSLSLANASNY